MLPETFEGAQSDVARVFGGDFEQALQALPVGSWAGPVESGFGAHLVLVRARQPGRTATLAEARAAVERDWLNDRAQQSNEAFYERLRSNYTVRIDGDIDAPAPAAPAG